MLISYEIIKDVAKKFGCLTLYMLSRDGSYGADSLLVPMYHRISIFPEPGDPLKVSASAFEKQIRFLKEHYTVISAKVLAQAINGMGRLPKNACLITFDDGWEDNYTNAFPILRRYDLPALIFLSTDYIGTGKQFWQVRLRQLIEHGTTNIRPNCGTLADWPELSDKLHAACMQPASRRAGLINELIEWLKPFSLDRIQGSLDQIAQRWDLPIPDKDGTMLSWEQVLEMSAHRIDFGAHGMSHAIFPRLSDDRIRNEMVESKSTIEMRIGRQVEFLAYPNGDYDSRTQRIVEEAGFLAGFTCNPGVNKDLRMPSILSRLNMREGSGDGLRGTFSPLFFRIELAGSRIRLAKLGAWIGIKKARC